MGVITEMLGEIRRDVEDLKNTPFKATKGPNGSVVISDDSPTYRPFSDFVAASPSEAEKKLRVEESAHADADIVLDAAAKGTLLATAAVVTYGVARRDSGLVYKGLVVGGYTAAELKFLGWICSMAAHLTRSQNDALEVEVRSESS